MELDKRIIEGKRPLTCIDIEQAKEFVGKLCLFSDSYVNYKNIREYEKCPQYTGILHIVEDAKRFHSEEDYIFRNETDGYLYSLVLPLEWVKPEEPEKKYRPFSLDEFLKIFNTGDLVEFRYKDSDEVKCAMFTGYITDVERIDDKTPGACELMLGCFHYSLLSLFKECELFYNGEWQPFGVIDEDME